MGGGRKSHSMILASPGVDVVEDGPMRPELASYRRGRVPSQGGRRHNMRSEHADGDGYGSKHLGSEDSSEPPEKHQDLLNLVAAAEQIERGERNSGDDSLDDAYIQSWQKEPFENGARGNSFDQGNSVDDQQVGDQVLSPIWTGALPTARRSGHAGLRRPAKQSGSQGLMPDGHKCAQDDLQGPRLQSHMGRVPSASEGALDAADSMHDKLLKRAAALSEVRYSTVVQYSPVPDYLQRLSHGHGKEAARDRSFRQLTLSTQDPPEGPRHRRPRAESFSRRCERIQRDCSGSASRPKCEPRPVQLVESESGLQLRLVHDEKMRQLEAHCAGGGCTDVTDLDAVRGDNVEPPDAGVLPALDVSNAPANIRAPLDNASCAPATIGPQGQGTNGGVGAVRESNGDAAAGCVRGVAGCEGPEKNGGMLALDGNLVICSKLQKNSQSPTTSVGKRLDEVGGEEGGAVQVLSCSTLLAAFFYGYAGRK
jgi:hypothetical protein